MRLVSAISTKLARFLSGASRSRLAWLAVFLHAAWFLLAIANMHPPSRDFAQFLEHSEGSTVTIFAGRPFHYAYESVSLQILFLLDLPSWFASVPFGFLSLPFFELFHVGRFVGSYIGAGIVLIASSLQWLIIGYRVDKWLGSKLWGPALLQRLHHSFAVLTILIFLLTAVSVPLINARSRRLASRHGAISFH